MEALEEMVRPLTLQPAVYSLTYPPLVQGGHYCFPASQGDSVGARPSTLRRDNFPNILNGPPCWQGRFKVCPPGYFELKYWTPSF